MAEEKSSEIAKMALDCLKIRLQADLANAEAQEKALALFKTLVEEISKAIPLLISEFGETKRD